MDVKSAFLNGVLEEEVYLEQPPEYMKIGEEKKVLKLKKALYRLKQAPRAWNTRIDTYFKKNGYKQCPHEHSLYTKKSGGNVILVALYVDDLIFSGNNDEMIEEFKSTVTREFEMTDLGLLKFFLGLDVKQEETSIFISQEKYAKAILRMYKMENCNPISTPMEPGAKLSKYDGGEQVDTSRYRSLVSRFMEEPINSHWKTLKRILLYAQGTLSRGLFYSRTEDYKLVGYSDSDWCGGIDDQKVHRVMYSSWATQHLLGSQRNKTASGYVFSTCEAEYVAAS